jgi:hypothetical protein
LGLLLNSLKETPTRRILLVPEPIVCDHAKVALVPPELGEQFEPELPLVAVAQSALLSILIAACDEAAQNAIAIRKRKYRRS